MENVALATDKQPWQLAGAGAGSSSSSLEQKLVQKAVVMNDASSHEYPRRVRLLSNSDFQQVFRHTQCKSIDNKFTLLARRNGLGHPRLGLAVSKRKIKTAVGRNRIKRLIRESFRIQQDSLPDVDVVVLARDGLLQASNAEIAESLRLHWQRLAKRCVNSSSC